MFANSALKSCTFAAERTGSTSKLGEFQSAFIYNFKWREGSAPERSYYKSFMTMVVQLLSRNNGKETIPAGPLWNQSMLK
jgi:hypothetical protein